MGERITVCTVWRFVQSLFELIFDSLFVGLPSVVVCPHDPVEVVPLAGDSHSRPVVVFPLEGQGRVILNDIDDDVISPSIEAKAGN